MKHSSLSFGLVSLLACFLAASCTGDPADTTAPSVLARNFKTPPSDARPGVYWYFMDGNFSKEGITKDLEAMRDQGIGYVVFLEVNVGVPRGNVDFMSPEWLDIFKHTLSECKRTGIKMVLGIGPGWTGSGGPWVKGEKSMQHLMASSTRVSGGTRVKVQLPVPAPNRPYFGEGSFTPETIQQWRDYYQDVCVLAFPTPSEERRIADIQEKGLFIRHPFSSMPGVRAYFPPADGDIPEGTAPGAVDLSRVVDITGSMQPDGTLEWDAPQGEWTVLRMGSRNNGAATRPAPTPGVGMECDKFSAEALREHLSNFTDKIFEACGGELFDENGGIELLHLDSWEMGAQNWNASFRDEFKKRRGYDPLPWFPAYTGLIVSDSLSTERFLWDVRKTAQELVIENHVGAVKEYAHERGLKISIEPYDMNPTADLELAVAADYPMAEFWSDGFGYNTTFAPAEGTSAAHLIGQGVVPAESFTSYLDAWRQYPGSLKNQTDWALAAGINRLMFHTFQHQCLPDSLRPGMTMGPYGVHWDRGQTWWPYSGAYHTYLARCQYLLQRGRTVADILYLAPESMPHAFKAPDTAFDDPLSFMPDRKGYNFDGCPPSMLAKAGVKDGRVVFPSGASYRIMVMPDWNAATPEYLGRILRLVKDGATLVGHPVHNAPGLADREASDRKVRELSEALFGNGGEAVRSVGKGKVVLFDGPSDNLYAPYGFTAGLMREAGIPEDFTDGSGSLRYTHRTLRDAEIYFVANRTDAKASSSCRFRTSGLKPELWDPLTGTRRMLPEYSDDGTGTVVPLVLDPHGSCFVVFTKDGTGAVEATANNALASESCEVDGPWEVTFDPKWGGPQGSVTFTSLEDWTANPDPSIRYYSGTAVYRTVFDFGKPDPGKEYLLSLGGAGVMARVNLNGKDLGVAWTDPWTVSLGEALSEGENSLCIEVVNLWHNRLIGDEQKPYDGPEGGRWPSWMQEGTPRTSGRFTFTTWRHYSADTPLMPSGLFGPVRVLER